MNLRVNLSARTADVQCVAALHGSTFNLLSPWRASSAPGEQVALSE
jgi:hypothetical protein